MNILGGDKLPRCGQKWWRGTCCRNLKFNPFYLQQQDNDGKTKSKLLMAPFICQPCTSRFSNLLLWNQIRFQKDYPRLHRDIKHPNFDAYRKEKFKDPSKTTWHSQDEKYGYTYVVGFFGLLGGMYCTKTELIHFLLSMSAPADVLALASIEIDIGNIAPGACLSYKWRGKPLFVKHRTVGEISAEAKTPLSLLIDPETPEQRTQKPEWLIVIGICTHLGCVPVPNSGDWAGGFYCPCHGSHYDNVGRARKGPAPLNLEVPPYTFLSDTLVLVG